jgi:hypothetical protein
MKHYEKYLNLDEEQEENIEEPVDEPEEYEEELEDLVYEMNELEEVFPDVFSNTEYDIRVKAKRLRFFTGPGINYVVLGRAKKGDKFTIIDESTGVGAINWGQMKHNQAWIPLDYCERI